MLFGKKSKVTFSIDQDVVCILKTLCGEFDLSMSDFIELLILSFGFGRFSTKGLYNAWNILFRPDVLQKFVSNYNENISLFSLLFASAHCLSCEDLLDDSEVDPVE